MKHVSQKPITETTRHFVRPIPFKAHRVVGFSPETLEHHYEEIYGGAVRKLNGVERQLADLRETENMGSEFVALKAEEQRLANAIALHEIHFEGLGEDGGEALEDEGLRAALDASFGTVTEWRDEVVSLARLWRGGPGWISLTWSENLGRLISAALSERQGLMNAIPIFALDMGDHAFSSDFGSDRAAYANAALDTLHWGRIAGRFNARPPSTSQSDPGQMSVQDLATRIDANDQKLLVLDIRHGDDRVRYNSRILQTEWRDSFKVADWVDSCPRDKTIVVYCMYGFWVSQNVAAELRTRGFDARSLEGGIAAWRAMGLPSSQIATE
ncbi:MAG: Fe-Mn family superoxide dismutase [Pseudomonadota bacterium]